MIGLVVLGLLAAVYLLVYIFPGFRVENGDDFLNGNINNLRRHLITLRRIPNGQSVSNITLDALYFGHDEDRRYRIDDAHFRQILSQASPASPVLAKGWQFSPWYQGSFIEDARTNYFLLFFGGLGVLKQSDGTKGLFLFNASSQNN